MTERLLLVVALLALAAGLGVVWSARNGRLRPVGARSTAHLGTAELGVPLGERATFVQFSSEVCTPCRRTAVVLADLVAQEPDVQHVELEVTEHLDLVRRFDVMRTPTVLVLDPRGRVVGRTSGATDRAQALAALESCPGTARVA